MFRVQGLRFFIDDIWMDHYKTLGALTVIIDDDYTSYLSRTIMERTLADGVHFISDATAFTAYEAEFHGYMKRAQAYAEALSFDTAAESEIKKLLNEIAHLFYFYSRTEFFYTDGAQRLFEETDERALGERLARMGQIKNDGREFLNGIFFGSDAVLSRLLKSFEQRFGIPERVLQQYSREEISGLFRGSRVSDEEIARRDDAFYILGNDDTTIIKTGTEARSDIQEFINGAAYEHRDTIKGTVAHPGKVQGRARIIRSGYDNFDMLHHLMDAMKEDDILVAETTSPELMPACKKAGGIITDQGGMLSHAAIVSRELNIPCIVGTSNATEVIRDGDVVEMDARNGVVKILEKGSS